MLKYTLKRLLHSIPLIIAIIIISFFIVHWMPGDPIVTMLGDKAPEEQIIRMRNELNLDKPLFEQIPNMGQRNNPYEFWKIDNVERTRIGNCKKIGLNLHFY